ncbi:MAG: EF-Tu/IF-2/RF-3 family GTPase, partial [Patescibacteria group bacterium]
MPRICFVNKLDRMGASFAHSYNSILERLTPHAIPVTIPVGLESDFAGIIDLMRMKYVRFEGEHGEKVVAEEIPDHMKAEASSWREKLAEKIAAEDDDLTERYLEGEALTGKELRASLRKSTIAYKIIPVFCGSALKNKGVQMVLDGIIDYLPSPKDLPPVKGKDPKTEEEITREALDSIPFTALAFKLQSDPYVGQLTYFRIYAGVLKAGSYILNTNTGERERAGRILRMHANHREEVKEIYAGEIGALVGMKNTHTGDTLSDPDHPIRLETITFPEPVVSMRIEPKTKQDQERMGIALKRLSEEDPTFRIRSDEETAETIISGMGELHLE